VVSKFYSIPLNISVLEADEGGERYLSTMDCPRNPSLRVGSQLSFLQLKND